MMPPRPPPTPLRRLLFKIGMLSALVLVVYMLIFVRSMRQIDTFCARVTPDTNVADLAALAQAVGGVRLVGPALVGGKVQASVANPMTMGDYACTLGAASMTGKVETKHLGY